MPTLDHSKPDVMISYARADARDFSGRLASELKRHGIDAWLDTSDIEGGAEWLRRIQEAIDASTVFIAVRSPAASDSFWVRSERLYALNRRKLPNPLPHIVPVLAAPCTADDLELISFQPVDFSHSFEMGLPVLLDRIRALRDGHAPETKDRRELELAYLGRILLEHSIWQDLYTPMAGVAQLLDEAPASHRPVIKTAATPIDTLFGAYLDEVEQAEHRSHESLRKEPYTDILDAVEDLRQLVVLGDPGCGKTTTLWRIAADYAKRAEKDEAAPLPVFVRLGQLKPEQSLEALILEQLGDLGPHYHTLLGEKRLALLLDGLNELPAQNRSAKAREVKVLVERCQRDGMVTVVTCRELDFVGDLRLDMPQHVTIEPLDPVRIRTFVNNYIQEPPEAGDTLFWQLAGEDARKRWQDFARHVGDDPAIFWRKERAHPRSMLTLAGTPYMLYMMTQVFTRRGELPQNRGRLFQQFVDFLLLKRERLSEAVVEVLKKQLAELAYQMQAWGALGTSVNRADALAVLGDEQRLYQAQSANILSGTDAIRFTHQLLQEFFAAHKLDREMHAGKAASEYWPPDRWWEPTGWEETAILLAGLYSDDCTPVLEWLRDANPELAARCVLESGAHTPDPIAVELRSRWVSRMFGDEYAPVRAAVGRAGGLAGDPRPGVGLHLDGVPDIDWVEIPAGEFLMGSDKDKDPQAYDDEIPQQTVYLEAFNISRYPITYAQYAAFVEDDGYANDSYWTAAGREWRAEKEHPEAYWNDPRWHIPNHPVVGVTWYEAHAFTRWLSVKLGLGISLPTEAQWERAARGTDGRIYPYGNEFDPTKGNTDETGIRRTIAVGIFPDGASPDGVLDMSGNVFEWSVTKWRDNYLEPEDNEPVGTARRVVRGGSWITYQGLARCAYRGGNVPDYPIDNIGFRVVHAYSPSL
ncbi:MAG: SUMF1/EgtB/PvdO family nonheme iron enzyme [Chloroflexi bacterium]|nr:SUMF1/EgtB/PvdO family nonheme iron enzyme [Chloroflexota bacterium]